MKTTTALMASLTMLAAPAAFAQDKEEIDNPWYDCGIGAMIFPDNDTAAAISNIIWDLGTTALTSAQSSPDTCEGERAQAALFINQTYAQLAAETAVGEGEHLAALGDLLGCSADAQSALTASVRAEMSGQMAQTGFSALTRTEKAEVYFNAVDGVVRNDLAGQCSAA